MLAVWNSPMDFIQLKKNLKKDFSQLPLIKTAVLGDSSTQLLVQALRGYAYEAGLNLKIYEADFDQISQQVLSADSELYAFAPKFTVLFFSIQHLLRSFCSTPISERSAFADEMTEKIRHLTATIQGRLPATKIILLNFPEFDDGVFGNYANKTNRSFLYQLRRLNLQLMDLAQANPTVFICDTACLASRVGQENAFDPKMYAHADLAFNLDFLPKIARSVLDIIRAVNGTFKKCLILDLDNTTWGGVVGDDGMENIQIGDLGIGKAFVELQLWAKELKHRGIVLAVCSKNDEKNAMEPFEKHPDMVLRLDDIAVFVANWESKVDNIRHIQSILNIGFDSMVFLDDSPFERNVVRENIPGITVPELPEDPAHYLQYLRTLNLFETASHTAEDAQRTEQYRVEARRAKLLESFTNENDFLQSLGMICEVRPFDPFTVPRIAQLSQRSNQFNLRTVRYTEDDIRRISQSTDHVHLSFSLRDRFGDYGLVSAVIVKKEQSAYFIDTWIMSCRVLRRGLEAFVLNAIAKQAAREGRALIRGEYIPTAKNGLVKDHYRNLGFIESTGEWHLEVPAFVAKETYIAPLEGSSGNWKMTSAEILAQTNQIFIDVLDDPAIHLERRTVAADIPEWNSLSHIQLVVAIEKHFKIQFTAKQIRGWHDVGTMCDDIAKMLDRGK